VEITVVAVGKLRPYYREACDDYARRLKRYVTFAEHEVREASRAPTAAAQLKDEAQRLGKKISEKTTVVALARQGTGWSSSALAQQLNRWMVTAPGGGDRRLKRPGPWAAHALGKPLESGSTYTSS
jgi:23S rRNA pseudoU1915 N3-methylase RlmH